jgi:UDP-glucose 4-epimerase
MKILVTGGAGFIGSHLSEALVANGDLVIAIDDLSTGNSANLKSLENNPNFKFVSGSILDEKLVSSLIESVDGVMHFAAAVGVQKILDDPIGSLKTNLIGSEIVLTCSAKFKKPTIFASTSEIYGKNSQVPLTEQSDHVIGMPMAMRWTYSASKAIDESIALYLHKKLNWPVKIIRLFNTVGPRQSSSYGMVIPRFIEAALSNQPLIVYGDGSQHRVFCHVEDVVSGIVKLWNCEKGTGEAFNLGGFEETSIKELANRIIGKTESQSIIQFIPYGQLTTGFEDIARRVPDTKKLQSLTGWRATKNLDAIIDDTIAELKCR